MTSEFTSGKPDFSMFDNSSENNQNSNQDYTLNDPDNNLLIDLKELVPPEKRTEGEPVINIFLKALTFSGASDLHLSYNVPPVLRKHGKLCPVKFKPFNPETMKKMIYQILDPSQRKDCDEKREVDACYDILGVGRYRMNIFHQLYGLSAVFRSIPATIKAIDEVGLSEDIAKLSLYNQGFIVVTGATGSGKSTTLAAMIDYINKKTSKHIVTIEDPLEFVHKNHRSIITHREVGTHSPSFAAALRAALRQDPDVILLGELRDIETIDIALTAAETGHMVMGTLHTNNASETVSRIISAFPADRQNQAAMQLSTVLRAIISQDLLPSSDGGRCPIREILVGTTGIRAMIRDMKIPQIYSAIETGKKDGMMTMTESVIKMQQAGRITKEIADQRIKELSSNH
jgi:twitching motility protein PilT